MKNNAILMMILAIIAAAAVGGYLLWPAKKKEKFVVYRPDPLEKNTWADDAVLTRVISGKLA